MTKTQTREIEELAKITWEIINQDGVDKESREIVLATVFLNLNKNETICFLKKFKELHIMSLAVR